MMRINGRVTAAAGVAVMLSLSSGAWAQLADVMVSTAISNDLNASAASGMNPGMLTGRANAAVGAANANMGATNAAMAPGALPPPPAGGPMMPGAPPLPGAPVPGADAGMAMPGGAPGMPPPAPGAAPGMPGAAPGAPGAAATPTPVPMVDVLEGQRIYDAVTGALLEDAFLKRIEVTRKAEKHFDDGIHDNGIAGDGFFGNVITIRDKYIGAETNGLKNRAIRVVRSAEQMSPMEFFRYHVATTNPRDKNPQMPKLLEKEKQQDELLADWNNKFLADYRVDKDNPQSEFFQLFVPRPPTPPTFPVPPGYVSPQKLQEGASGQPGAPGAPGAAPTPNIYNGDPVMDVPI